LVWNKTVPLAGVHVMYETGLMHVAVIEPKYPPPGVTVIADVPVPPAAIATGVAAVALHGATTVTVAAVLVAAA